MTCARGCGEMGVCHPNREDLLASLYATCEGAGGHYREALVSIMDELADAIWPKGRTEDGPDPDLAYDQMRESGREWA